MSDNECPKRAIAPFAEATNSKLSSTYWSKGIRTNKIPAKLVTVQKPLHDGEGGWKAKARVVCCGKIEPGSVGEDLQNRAEVPSTYGVRTLLAIGAEKGWSSGSLDVKTAFLYAELNVEEDGIMVVPPPSILVRMGLVEPGIMWKLKKALCGLRCAPKRWSQERGRVLQDQPVALDGQLGRTQRCKATQGLWKVICDNKIVGYFLLYVGDLLIVAKTKWILATMQPFGNNWECTHVGILVTDDEYTDLAVQSLV